MAVDVQPSGALRPGRQVVLSKPKGRAGHDIAMKYGAEMEEARSRVWPKPAEGGFGKFKKVGRTGPLPRDIGAGARVLPIKQATEADLDDIFSGFEGLRVAPAEQKSQAMEVEPARTPSPPPLLIQQRAMGTASPKHPTKQPSSGDI
jgi:hypothetical protein